MDKENGESLKRVRSETQIDDEGLKRGSKFKPAEADWNEVQNESGNDNNKRRFFTFVGVESL